MWFFSIVASGSGNWSEESKHFNWIGLTGDTLEVQKIKGFVGVWLNDCVVLADKGGSGVIGSRFGVEKQGGVVRSRLQPETKKQIW